MEWHERAQTAEASLLAAQEATETVKKKYRLLTDTFGIKESTRGDFKLDYDMLVENLGLEQWLELRAIGDAKYNVSGDAGQKPRVRMPAATEAVV